MSTRDLRLDTLRGIFLVLMTIDHIGGKLTAFTYEPFGFVSAAAGFVLLSAYMYAFTTRNTPSNGQALMVQSWKRAAKLYRYHMALFALLVLLTLISPVHHAYLSPKLYPADITPLDAMLYGASLLHQPALMHLLPMYLLFSLLSPAVLMAFRRGWYAPVFAASMGLWIWGQFFNPLEWLVAISSSGANAGDANLFCWQLLWVSGLYIGFVHGVEKRTNFFNSPFWLSLAVVVAIGFFLVRHSFIDMPNRFDLFVERSDSPLRLLNIISQVVLFLYLVQFVPRQKGIPWFKFLGKYGLQVFCFHVFLLAFLAPVSWRIGMHFGYAIEAVYLAAAAASLIIPAMLYRAYEAQLHAGGVRTWTSRMSATRFLVRGLMNITSSKNKNRA
jgi:hypothetical protein